MKQTEYEYLRVVRAVCAETGQAEAILSPHLNMKVMNAFIREFSRTLAPDVHAVLLWDGAGFHRSGKLQLPDNVSLVELCELASGPEFVYATESHSNENVPAV